MLSELSVLGELSMHCDAWFQKSWRIMLMREKIATIKKAAEALLGDQGSSGNEDVTMADS